MTYANTVIFTVNGFQGDLWTGPQAATGAALSAPSPQAPQGQKLAYWQPIGYASGDFPLSLGINAGLAELQNQMQLHMAGGQIDVDGTPRPPMTNLLVSAWSEGAIIATLAYINSFRGVAGWPPLSMWQGATMFGNPYRQVNNWVPNMSAPQFGTDFVPNPGGEGIGGPRDNLGEGTNPPTPPWWGNYAHPGDMYSCTPDNDAGLAIRTIADFVLTQWNGAFQDLWAFVQAMDQNIVAAIGGIIGAITIAVSFYSSGTAAHIDYDPTDSINYMVGVAGSLP